MSGKEASDIKWRRRVGQRWTVVAAETTTAQQQQIEQKNEILKSKTTINISNDVVVSYRCERSSVARQVMPPFVNRRTDARKIELMSSNVGLCEREKTKQQTDIRLFFFFNSWCCLDSIRYYLCVFDANHDHELRLLPAASSDEAVGILR